MKKCFAVFSCLPRYQLLSNFELKLASSLSNLWLRWKIGMFIRRKTCNWTIFFECRLSKIKCRLNSWGIENLFFFTFIFEKKVVPSSNLVCNFTIKYSFGKVIEMFCSPSKFYWHLHFFCKNQSSLRKADEAISWITLVL